MTFVALVAAALLAHQGAPAPTIPDCFTQVVAPKQIVLACGDGNFWIGALRWRGWGDATAAATGTANQNDCDPYCAAGQFHAYPVTVTASAPRTCRSGRRQYTLLEYRYTGDRPAGAAATGSEAFPCKWPLHPGLTARRSGGSVVLAGSAWIRSAACPGTVALTSAGAAIATPRLTSKGSFRVVWKAPAGRHVVVARQQCGGASLREATVVVHA